ncbi:MAG: prepilin-type N-terminal cleavage/methylation domain-containing protein [Achromobacter sp.]
MTCRRCASPGRRPPVPPRRRERGFSLIEVMIAITLMALVSLLAWRGLTQISTARDWLDRSAEDNDVLVRTLGQIELDLNQVDMGYRLPSATDAGAPRLPPGITLNAGQGDAPSLEVVRASARRDGTWQRVAWRIRDGDLWRMIGRPGTTYPLDVPVEGTLMMRDVKQLDIRLWVPAQGWISRSARGGGAATGIEVAIDRGQGAASERYTRVVVLR